MQTVHTTQRIEERDVVVTPPHPTDRSDVKPVRLGWWRRRVNPVILDRIMDTGEAHRIRERVCAPLFGDVLEIGFGSGLNLPHLPSDVHHVYAVDPLERSWELAADRLAACDADVERIGPDARTVPLPDRSVDAVLCTWNLCSIDDAHLAVAEIARVLRPGGELHFVEHGRSDDPRVRRWQHRCDPVWSRVACGCHLDRDIPSIIEAGGMHMTQLATYYTESEPKILGWTIEGRAAPQ